MKGKKLNYFKLILANILIFLLILLILMITPNKPEINLTIVFIYVVSVTLFNGIITEK